MSIQRLMKSAHRSDDVMHTLLRNCFSCWLLHWSALIKFVIFFDER